MKNLSSLRHLLVCCCFIAIALAACLILENREQAFRLSGMVLQLLGIGTVAVGISTTRKLFGLPSLLERIEQLWKRVRSRRGATQFGGASGKIGLSARGMGYGTANAGANATVEDRLDSLDENVRMINERISAVHVIINKDLRDVEEKLKAESSARRSGDSEIQGKLFLASASGLDLTGMGVGWLFFGVVFSSASNELAYLLAWLL